MSGAITELAWPCAVVDGFCETCQEPNYFTVKAAAVRTGRSVRTIERWIEHGLTCRPRNGRLEIPHQALLEKLRVTRERMNNRRVGASW